MSLIDQLQALELVAQLSAEQELRAHLEEGMCTVYAGFDPSADSLHIGNLVPLLALRRFQIAGHRPLLLVGGATGMIGDPGGRDSERDLQPRDVVESYLKEIKKQASQYLDFDCGVNSAIVVNNSDWTENLSAIDFLRDIGKHFSVNTMIQKESVRRRLDDESQGISYTEFSYMILQAYDFVVLNREYGCTIQMGGSDQWGNITAGIDLLRRMDGKQAFAVTYPLVTKSDGTKFGKSSGGAIWLDAHKTSPYSFFQFWRNTADDDVMSFLKTFTFLDSAQFKTLLASHEADPGRREAHSVLANEVTKLVHGNVGLTAAVRITEALFGNRVGELTETDLEQLALDGMQTLQAIEPLLVDVLVDSGLAITPRGEITHGQARKLVVGNSISVNGEKVIDLEYQLTKAKALFGKYYVVQKGKKNHCLVLVDGL